MNPNIPELSDSVFNALVLIGALAAAVYITLYEEIRSVRREKIIRESEPVIADSKESQSLADYYIAVAYGDYENIDYWTETAEQFENS